MRTDGENPFDSQFFDYKLIWETEGRFGFFNGTTTTVTSTTTNTVSYTVLDEDTELGTENVTCRVYARRKGESGPWDYLDRVSTAIEINNDDDTLIIYATPNVVTSINAPTFYVNWGVSLYFEFEPVKNAQSYTLEVIEHVPDAIPSYVGTGKTWQAGNPDDLVDGKYRFRTRWRSGSSPPPLSDTTRSRIAEAQASLAATQATVRVTVKLQPGN